MFIKTGPVPTCGAVLKVHFDQMFVTASREDDILKLQQQIARKPSLFSSAVLVDMVDRKKCDETHEISIFPFERNFETHLSVKGCFHYNFPMCNCVIV